MEINLDQHKDKDGFFIALALPYEPYWKTEKGQKYLEEFYYLEEIHRMGIINTDELNVYHDQLVHPGKPCPWSTTYNALFEEGSAHVSA